VFAADKKSASSHSQFIGLLVRAVRLSESTAKLHFSDMVQAKIISKEKAGDYTLNV